MLVSTNGILFYGIAYGEDLDTDAIARANGIDPNADNYEGFTSDFDKFYANRMGIMEPAVEYNAQTKPLFTKYWEEKRNINKQCGIGVHAYCSGDYPMYFVCIEETRYVAYRGDAVEIPIAMTNWPKWDAKLKAYCELMHLPFKDPKWLLVSYWG